MAQQQQNPVGAASSSQMQNRADLLQNLRTHSFNVRFDLQHTLYEQRDKLGIGAYGVVCAAQNRKTGERVAIKKICRVLDHPVTAKRTLREIYILRSFQHDNIISIVDLFTFPPQLQASSRMFDLYVVFQLMETDLHRIIQSPQLLTIEHVRFFIYQILRGLAYIHSAGVVHRDLKPSNLLVNADCELKIADFGMARCVSAPPTAAGTGPGGITVTVGDESLLLTQYVATRWYRSPELLLGQRDYSYGVDLWSTGCILGELLGRKQLFPGRTPAHQMDLITGILGTPPETILETYSPEVRRLLLKFGPRRPLPLQVLYPNAPKQVLNMLLVLLDYDASARPTAEAALEHPFMRKYHDKDDEPKFDGQFHFGYSEKMSIDELHVALVQEVAHWGHLHGTVNPFDSSNEDADSTDPNGSILADPYLASMATQRRSDDDASGIFTESPFAEQPQMEQLSDVEQPDVEHVEAERAEAERVEAEQLQTELFQTEQTQTEQSQPEQPEVVEVQEKTDRSEQSGSAMDLSGELQTPTEPSPPTEKTPVPLTGHVIEMATPLSTTIAETPAVVDDVQALELVETKEPGTAQLERIEKADEFVVEKSKSSPMEVSPELDGNEDNFDENAPAARKSSPSPPPSPSPSPSPPPPAEESSTTGSIKQLSTSSSSVFGELADVESTSSQTPAVAVSDGAANSEQTSISEATKTALRETLLRKQKSKSECRVDQLVDQQNRLGEQLEQQPSGSKRKKLAPRKRSSHEINSNFAGKAPLSEEDVALVKRWVEMSLNGAASGQPPSTTSASHH